MTKALSTERTSRRSAVQSVEVGLSVLAALSSLGGTASLSELAGATGIAAPKVHRYLSSLVAGGFVRQDEEGGSYRLGLTALTVGLAALRANDPVRLAGERLAGLRTTVGATCFVAVPANAGPTVVLVAEGPGAVVVNVRLGSTLPIDTSATGRVLQASADLSASIADTALVGVSAVSAAVRDHLGVPVAAITALGATGTIDITASGAVARAVREAAAAVSAAIGYVATA